MNQKESLLKFLDYLGLDFQEAKSFLYLAEAGEQTVLEISRETDIPRTTVYRIVERLMEIGLIEEIISDNKKLYKSVGTHKLEILVKERESQLDYLKKLLPDIDSLLPSHQTLTQPGTKVLFYRGKPGIRQMVWNTLRAEDEVLGYTYRPLEEVVGIEFERKWLLEFMQRKLTFRDVVGEDYLSQRKGKERISEQDERYFETKFISANVLDVNHQIDIYNNVMGIYNWHEGDVFGIEIYNQKIAKFQRQLFNLVWDKAVPSR